MERLEQFMTFNEELIKFWNEVKASEQILKVISSKNTIDTSKNIYSSTIKKN